MSELVRLKLRDHISILSGFPFASENFSDREGTPLIRIRDLLSDGIETFYLGPYPDDFLVGDGDVLVGMDGDFNAVRWAKGRALLNQRVCKVFSTSKELNQGFLFWVLGPELVRIHRRTPQTTVRHLSTKDVYELELELPPADEQAKVVQILDTLDTQIRQTEALIAKLERIKQGLLTDLLTRGIDQNGHLRPPPDQAPHLYKDSPLGQIPRGWEVTPLGILSEIVSGVTLGGAPLGLSARLVPYLRVANVQDGFLDLSEIKYIWVTAAEAEKFRLREGDVLMNEGGDYDKLGRGTVWRDEIADCIHQNHVFRVRPDTSVLLSDYLAAYSASPGGKSYFLRSSKQSTNLASINSTQLKAFPIPLAPLREQYEINSVLFGMNARIDAEGSSLRKLLTQKFGLMDDLLTGRVRVTPLLDTAEQTFE